MFTAVFDLRKIDIISQLQTCVFVFSTMLMHICCSGNFTFTELFCYCRRVWDFLRQSLRAYTIFGTFALLLSRFTLFISTHIHFVSRVCINYLAKQIKHTHLSAYAILQHTSSVLCMPGKVVSTQPPKKPEASFSRHNA